MAGVEVWVGGSVVAAVCGCPVVSRLRPACLRGSRRSLIDPAAGSGVAVERSVQAPGATEHEAVTGGEGRCVLAAILAGMATEASGVVIGVHSTHTSGSVPWHAEASLKKLV